MFNEEKNNKSNQSDSNNDTEQRPIVREEDIIRTEPIRINESFGMDERNVRNSNGDSDGKTHKE